MHITSSGSSLHFSVSRHLITYSISTKVSEWNKAAKGRTLEEFRQCKLTSSKPPFFYIVDSPGDNCGNWSQNLITSSWGIPHRSGKFHQNQFITFRVSPILSGVTPIGQGWTNARGLGGPKPDYTLKLESQNSTRTLHQTIRSDMWICACCMLPVALYPFLCIYSKWN